MLYCPYGHHTSTQTIAATALPLSALVPNFRRTAAAKLEEERLVETMSALDEGKFWGKKP